MSADKALQLLTPEEEWARVKDWNPKAVYRAQSLEAGQEEQLWEQLQPNTAKNHDYDTGTS